VITTDPARLAAAADTVVYLADHCEGLTLGAIQAHLRGLADQVTEPFPIPTTTARGVMPS
jgi:hypothetical protein